MPDYGFSELWSYEITASHIDIASVQDHVLISNLGRGFHVTTETPKSDSLSLFKHGERAYDHVVLLPAKTKGLGPALTANLLLDFMKKEGNVLLALSSEQATPTAVQSLLLELDIHIPSDKGALVVDHFNYDTASASDKHDVLLLPFPKALRPDVKNYFSGNGVLAVPRAVGQTLGNESPLVKPILRAPSTAYSYNPKDEADIVEDPFAVGSQLNLVSAMQAHNSARLTVVGSAEMLQNKWFAEKATLAGKDVKTANREFAEKLSSWTFKETGVLKIGKLVHYLDEGVSKKVNTSVAIPENNPTIYRIKSDIVSSAKLGIPKMHFTNAFRLLLSRSQNGTRTTLPPSSLKKATLSRWNSACSPPSTA
jgi:oligosaccharyltransferase complex subunit beta